MTSEIGALIAAKARQLLYPNRGLSTTVSDACFFDQSSSQYLPGSTDKRALLRSHPFFRGLDNRIVEALVLRAVTKKVKRGTLLFRKGEPGSSLHVVCTGAVRVSAPSEQGKDAVFSLFVPGEIFGEIAFLDGLPRTADAVMIEAGELIVIERRDFLPILRGLSRTCFAITGSVVRAFAAH